jgi:hypothetical protein
MKRFIIVQTFAQHLVCFWLIHNIVRSHLNFLTVTKNKIVYLFLNRIIHFSLFHNKD